MSDVKRQIREAVASCLGIEPEEVSDSDGFLDLGLDSLSARKFADLVDGIAQELGGHVTVIDVFQYPNVSALANHVESLARHP